MKWFLPRDTDILAPQERHLGGTMHLIHSTNFEVNIIVDKIKTYSSVPGRSYHIFLHSSWTYTTCLPSFIAPTQNGRHIGIWELYLLHW